MRTLRRFWNKLLGRDTFSSSSVGDPATRIVVTRPVFALSRELVALLCADRDARGHDSVAQSYDAFMLDPGLGPPTYLCADGRVLWEDDTVLIYDVQGTRGEAIAAIFAGIRKTGISELRALLPERPDESATCVNCRGTGRFDAQGRMRDWQGNPLSVICMDCAGLGWTAESLDLNERLTDADAA